MAPSDESDVLDPVDVAPLVLGLHDPSPEIRIASFEALTRLPLHMSTWAAIRDYGERVLASQSAEHEWRAIVDAAPAIPLRSLRHLVERFVAEGGDEIRTYANRNRFPILDAGEDGGDSPLRPRWAPHGPPGFTEHSDAEFAEQAARLAALGFPGSPLERRANHWFYLRLAPYWREVGRPFASVAVTTLLRTGRFGLPNEVVEWVGEMQGSFRPDLDRLFDEYAWHAAAQWAEWRNLDLFPTFFEPDSEQFHRWVCWQIAWTLSRGGLRELVPRLERPLRSGDRDERLAAICLIADAADYSTEATAPIFGGGLGPRRRAALELLDDTGDESWGQVAVGPSLSSQFQVDKDVQFSVYRPRVVRPERWYPLLAFVHRTTLVEDPDGTVIDPAASVERQAAALLADVHVPFDAVRSDGPELQRGSELTLVPWLEGGTINPTQATMRWEEPIHRLEFRMRAPVAAEGQRLTGGLEVFRSGLLIGEVSFRITVTTTASEDAPDGDRIPVKLYRSIFASYSHKDTEIVKRVSGYIEVTGDRYVIDVVDLRSGEQWAPALKELIAGADIFHLYWSRNAMASEFVRREWEYALALRRPGFVRPLYWEVPLPVDKARGLPPTELSALHFTPLPEAFAESPLRAPPKPSSADMFSWDDTAVPSGSRQRQQAQQGSAQSEPASAGEAGKQASDEAVQPPTDWSPAIERHSRSGEPAVPSTTARSGRPSAAPSGRSRRNEEEKSARGPLLEYGMFPLVVAVAVIIVVIVVGQALLR